MEFLGRVLDVLLWVALVVWVGRKLMGRFSRAGRTPRVSAVPPVTPKPLYRDPWCGTYVSAEISRPLEQAGQTLHFCSEECLARYVACQRRAARA